MAEQNRQWVDLPRQLYLTDATCNCDFCGKRVSRRYLRVSEQGRNFRFCNEDCRHALVRLLVAAIRGCHRFEERGQAERLYEA